MFLDESIKRSKNNRSVLLIIFPLYNNQVFLIFKSESPGFLFPGVQTKKYTKSMTALNNKMPKWHRNLPLKDKYIDIITSLLGILQYFPHEKICFIAYF